MSNTRAFRTVVALCAIPLYAVLCAPLAFGDPVLGTFTVIERDDMSPYGYDLEGQFGVLVDVATDPLAAYFTFYNYDLGEDTIDSSITQIYWDTVSPPLLDYGTRTDGWSGVIQWPTVPNWDALASPGNVPGWDNVDFAAAFSADPDNPTPLNGIRPGDDVTFGILLADGVNGDQLLDALLDGSFRLAIHVQSIGENGEYSDSFLSTFISNEDPGSPVPIPGAAGLGILGMGMVGLLHGYGRNRRAAR